MRKDTTRRSRRRLAVPAAVLACCLPPAAAAVAENDAALGLRLAAEGRCPEAIDPLRRALREDENDCAVRTALGSCLLTLGRIERGERVLEDAPTCADADALEAAALAAWRHRRLDLAGSLFERVAELAPERPELHAYLAQIRFGEGRLDEAAASARRALEARPDDVQMRGLLALALTRAGRDEEAVPELARYIEGVPQDAGARFLLARLHVRLGNRREAVEQLRRLVAEAPGTVVLEAVREAERLVDEGLAGDLVLRDHGAERAGDQSTRREGGQPCPGGHGGRVSQRPPVCWRTYSSRSRSGNSGPSSSAAVSSCSVARSQRPWWA